MALGAAMSLSNKMAGHALQLIKKLGAGGMGGVFAATITTPRPGQPASVDVVLRAVKPLKPLSAGNRGLDCVVEAAVGQLLARFPHGNVLTFADARVDDEPHQEAVQIKGWRIEEQAKVAAIQQQLAAGNISITEQQGLNEQLAEAYSNLAWAQEHLEKLPSSKPALILVMESAACSLTDMVIKRGMHGGAGGTLRLVSACVVLCFVLCVASSTC